MPAYYTKTAYYEPSSKLHDPVQHLEMFLKLNRCTQANRPSVWDSSTLTQIEAAAVMAANFNGPYSKFPTVESVLCALYKSEVCRKRPALKEQVGALLIARELMAE